MRAETFSILFIAVPAKSQTQPSLQLMLKMNKCHTNEGQACDPCVTPEHFWLRLWDAWVQDFSVLPLFTFSDTRSTFHNPIL